MGVQHLGQQPPKMLFASLTQPRAWPDQHAVKYAHVLSRRSQLINFLLAASPINRTFGCLILGSPLARKVLLQWLPDCCRQFVYLHTVWSLLLNSYIDPPTCTGTRLGREHTQAANGVHNYCAHLLGSDTLTRQHKPCEHDDSPQLLFALPRLWNTHGRLK